MQTLVFSTIFSLLCLCVDGIEYSHHLTLKPGVFDLHWTVNTTINPQTVYFKYVAKTNGWAGLGWSITPNGQGMIQYDVAIGGVRNSNESYLKDYYSHSLGKPQLDPNPALQSLVLTSATESGGFTTIEFNRRADTGDTGNDVPIKNGTKTWIMWGIASADVTDQGSFSKHSEKGYTSVPYDLFSEEQLSPDKATTAPATTAASTTLHAGSIMISPGLATVLLVHLGSVLVMLH